jgi:hypothetical protein
MRKKTIGLAGMAGLLVLANLTYAEPGKANTTCDPKNSQMCGMNMADAKTTSTEAKTAAPTPAAPVEAKTPAQAPAAPAEAKTSPASTSGLLVDELAVATAIENRAPQGAAETFPATTEKLYCYTKLSGGKEGDTIVHKWSHDGKVVSEITLKVNGSSWRTFSSKTLGENPAGAWTVDVLQDAKVLKTAKFEVTK